MVRQSIPLMALLAFTSSAYSADPPGRRAPQDPNQPYLLFRMVKVTSSKGTYTYHYYTTSCDDVNEKRQRGYKIEKWPYTAPYIWNVDVAGSRPFQRLELPSVPNGIYQGTAYFYTASDSEFSYMIQRDWRKPTLMGFIGVEQRPGWVPLYRSWNRGDADWFYTNYLNEHEASKSAGWNGSVDGIINPGIAGYVAQSGNICLPTDGMPPPDMKSVARRY